MNLVFIVVLSLLAVSYAMDPEEGAVKAVDYVMDPEEEADEVEDLEIRRFRGDHTKRV